MRGKVDGNRRSDFELGITPARAGKRVGHQAQELLIGDHPRACGEKTKRIPILSHCFQVKGSFSFSFS